MGGVFRVVQPTGHAARRASSRQAISQHLAVLEDAGLVSSRRFGRTKLHHLHTEPLREIAERWPAEPKE